MFYRTRQWFPTVQEWTIYEENLDEQIRTAKLSSSEEENRVLIVPEGENIRSSNGMISCPASQNGDNDDDVKVFLFNKMFDGFVFLLFFSDVSFVTIHSRISLMIIVKNGI